MEREFKHTPGPWKSSPSGRHSFEVTRSPSQKYNVLHVCEVVDLDGVTERAEANAKLIAAAPELLEALKTLVEKCLNSDGYNQKIDELFQAQQAINKATS